MRVTTNDFCPSIGPTLTVERASREQASIDHRLRAYYDALLRQPVPDRFLEMIETLAAAEAPAPRAKRAKTAAPDFLFEAQKESALACAE